MTELELARAAAKALDSKKALDLKILRITELSVIADYFVIATGTSNTQVKALADEVEFRLKEQGVAPGHRAGYHSNSWVLLDYGSVVVHVFTPESRNFYDLDRLWKDGEEVDPGLSE